MTRRTLLLLALAVLCRTSGTRAADDAPTAPPAARLKIFDGKPKTIVCITNSHRGGGKDFEKKLTRYFADKGAKNPIVLRNAGGWATPVDPVTGGVEKGSWLDRFTLDKEKALGHPVVVIALSGVTTPRPDQKGGQTPVTGATVAAGVARCQFFVKAVKAKGADEVFLSTYHYFETATAPNQRSQYDLNYTLRVFADFNQATGDHYGIDCITLAKQHHPAGVADDQFHPSAAGHAIYAHCWFEALLKHDGLEVPAWSAEEVTAAVKAAAATATPNHSRER